MQGPIISTRGLLAAHVSYPGWTRLRRWSQTGFLALFLVLLSRTDFRGTFRRGGADFRLPEPVNLFFRIDPLAAFANALATGALYRGLLWSLAIILPTLVLGRFFCGWVCPLGTLHHFVSTWKSSRKRGVRLLESNRYHRWQMAKYYLLLGLLIAAVFGSAAIGWLDPLSLLVRSLGLSLLPALNQLSSCLPYEVDVVLRHTLLGMRQPQFRQAFFLGVVFLALLAANLWVTRFWCRALCPLGGLLGLLSRWSILGLEKDRSHCDECNRCLIGCQGGDDPIPGAKWRKHECHLCLNCVGECPESGIRFRFFPSAAQALEHPDLERRHVLASLAAGTALVPVLRAAPPERPVRPPGALDETAFLDRCIRCGECMKVCPNHALQPAWMEAGFESLWTPVLVPRIGYCEPACILCGTVCPTGAIWEFTSREKAWGAGTTARDARPIRIGTAFYDRGRCLPWAMATECIVCEEWCPTSPKAIYLRPADVAGPDGAPKSVRQPYIDPQQCVGCGACEFACPVHDRPAVYVTSIGETRSRANQILLKPGGRPS